MSTDKHFRLPEHEAVYISTQARPTYTYTAAYPIIRKCNYVRTAVRASTRIEYGHFRETSHLGHHGTSMITQAAGCSGRSAYIYQSKRIHNSEDIKLQGHGRRSTRFQNYNRNHNTADSRCLSSLQNRHRVRTHCRLSLRT